ncbi:hypothetical protein HAX54_052308 [Datura stramonium]|uniref:UBC core domain-containing protein n=1 Tax=Datura stramonium TaxID=4076 RepID=A0ABS8SYS7_DATST|nr:hypothetical protein [Datura stramonium]
MLLTSGVFLAGEGKKSAATIKFPHFDVVSDESDHYYMRSNLSNKDRKCFNDTNTAAFRSIMKEWKILEKNLPESIYVRTYELRMDLLRAVIVGAPGTPYHDGLFFFDIVFPSDYPNHPPSVYYLSRGYHMNPNLYSNGFVCLSLINTWNGNNLEKWTPTKSTILQLLVSIQGLVLNDQPYFNEPGREKHIKSEGWLKKSLAYNEEIFILSCKTMLCHIRTPPKNFEGFVYEHFRERGQFILAAVKDYGAGKAAAGQYQVPRQPSSRVYASVQFQKNSKKMFVELQNAFKKLSNSTSSTNQVQKAKEPAKKKKGKNAESSGTSLKLTHTNMEELPSGVDFLTFDDWDFDVEDETRNIVFVKEKTDDNKKSRNSLISALNILKDYGNGFRKLKGQKIVVETSESECTPSVCKLSTDEILRLGGEKFIQSTEQSSSISSLDHPYASSLLSLPDEDSKTAELVKCLLASAEKVGEKQYDRATKLLNECDMLSSKTGNPVERLVYYFTRALRERVDRETRKQCTKGSGLHGMQDLQDTLRSINACTIAVQYMPLCQVVKFAGIQAIVENVENSKKIHIIDLEIKVGVQWTILMQALATHQQNSEDPLDYLKITALLGADQSRTNVEETGKRLMNFAESFHFPFSFKIVTVEDILDLDMEDLDIDPEEAIVVYSQYFLSNMIKQQHRLDFLMGFIKGLNPRIMIVAEVEANLNSPVFVNRFIEALFYHGAFFDLFEDCMKNDESTRTTMESEVMWHGIRNIIAVEGEERTIRHVSIDLWREYFKRFGMVEMKMSNSSLYQAKTMVEKFSGGNSFMLEMNENFLVIGWKGTPLNSLSAWKFQKRSAFHRAYLTI